MTRAGIASLVFAAAVAGQDSRPGSAVDDFLLTTTGGRTVPYSALRGDVTVIVFLSTECPISNDYNERMKQVYLDYVARGVKFAFVNANRTEPASDVEAHRRSVGFPFPVYQDPDHIAADRFGAAVTPETFVIDRAGVVRYHGPIDDSRNPARVRVRALSEALEAVLAGRAVRRPEIKAFGCTIKRLGKKPT